MQKEMSPAQRERQEHRENGKYAKVNPCYVCGKSAGVDYYSHPDTDGLINDDLLCLCKKCSDKLGKYDGKTAIEIAFGKGKKDSNEIELKCLFCFRIFKTTNKEERCCPIHRVDKKVETIIRGEK